jgi:glycosyltransferase involved in cell wall biosynthesis
MANQCEQLARLLRSDGIAVELVRNNAPYRPSWIGAVPVVRAGFRLLPYLLSLWRAAGRAQVLHVFANSGWAWHLFAAPALLAARLRETAVIVNYRGGHADGFLAMAPGHVLRSLRRATLRVTPSPFLQRVFAKHGLDAEVVPNIIDLSRFEVVPPRDFGDAPRILVARNLEPIYDIATAIRALVAVRRRFSGATLTVAGSGPELPALKSLVTKLGLDGAVAFTGRVENAEMPRLYATADCVVNPSTVDNMPISLLEAFASGLPVVSTDAGGIPDMLEDGVSGLLVPVGDAETMGREVCRVLEDRALAARLVAAARAEAEKYAWPRVKARWLDAYRRAAALQGAA